MRQTAIFLAALLFFTIKGNSADLIVNNDGMPGAYANISAAITAASAGEVALVVSKL